MSLDSQNLWITLLQRLDDVSAYWHGRKISVRRKIYKSQLRESSHASQPSWFQAGASNVAQWTAFKARRFKATLLCNEEKKWKSMKRWLRFKGRSRWIEKRFCCARVTWATRFVSWDEGRVPELERPCKIDGNLETASEWCSILYKISETFKKFELCIVLGRYDFLYISRIFLFKYMIFLENFIYFFLF